MNALTQEWFQIAVTLTLRSKVKISDNLVNVLTLE